MNNNLNRMPPAVHPSSSNAVGIPNPMRFPLPLPSITMSAPPMHIPHIEIPPEILADVAPHLKQPHLNTMNISNPMQNLPPLPPLILPTLPPMANMPRLPHIPSTFHHIPGLLPMPRIPIHPMSNVPPLPLNISNKNKKSNTRTKKAKPFKKPAPKQPKTSPKKRSRPRVCDLTENLEPPPLIELEPRPQTTHHSNANLPLGHPKRIQFIDTMSEAFDDKNKNEKRSVALRTWRRPKKCRECGTTFPCADAYDTHRMLYHSEGIEVEQRCCICSQPYRERRYLNRHLRNSHFKYVCKIDGNGVNREGTSNVVLKKKKGNESICGYRFFETKDLNAHQAIVHGYKNNYRMKSEKGPVIQFMNGSDAKNIVIERLEWKIKENAQHNHNDNRMMDGSDRTMILKKEKKRKKSLKKEKKSNKKKKDKRRKREKTKKKKKGASYEEAPPPKKQKVEQNANTNTNAPGLS